MHRRVLSLLLILAATTSAHAQVVLVQDGQPRAAIYVSARVLDEKDQKPQGPRSLEREAETQRQRLRESVKDLAHYLEKMSGAKIEIRTTPPGKDAGLLPILVGDDAFPPQKKFPFKQGFRVVVSKKGASLSGESDLAVSYAIYEILDRLGCRWYMPSELGEVIPTRKTIVLPEGDESLTPGTIYRGLWFADDAYRRRNRHGGLLLQAGHALEFYVTKEEREKHPEWKGEVGGKPHPTRLKWSNPQVADAIARHILAGQEKSPSPSWSLSPDDGIDFDESKEDRALDAGDWDGPAQTTSLTDRLMVLCNRIAEKVHAKHPDILFGMLAYAQYTRAPVREKVHPSIVPQIAPITYTRAHPVTDDNVPGNKDLRVLIENWGKKAKYTSIYYYGWFLAEPSAPHPMIKMWSVNVPFVLKNNCQFFQPETMPNFETSMHGLYLGCRLAWNPRLDPMKIIDELHEKFYGHAAKEMAAYWHFIDDVWTTTPEYSGCGFGYLRRWTPERLARARALLDAGLAACQTPVEVQRVRLADQSLELFELFMKLRRDLAEGRWTDLKMEGDIWLDQVNYLGRKYEKQYTFTRTGYRPTTVNGSYFRQFYHQTYTDAARVVKEGVLLTKPEREFAYHIDPDKKGEGLGWHRPDFDDKAWKKTDVCHETWSTLGHHDYFKSMWYRTRFQVPALPKGKKAFLWLGATDGSVKVFVNGKHVPYVDVKGKTRELFEGYCQPVSFDVTEALHKGPNTIALLCTRTFFNELGTGGLLAPVALYREK